MNIETGAISERTGKAPRPDRQAGLQLSLSLEVDPGDQDALRAAWARSGLRMPFHVALQNRTLAICLRCLAEAMRRKAGKNGGHADAKCGSSCEARTSILGPIEAQPGV